MSNLQWKTMLAVAAVLVATVYAFAQRSADGSMSMHGQMGGMMSQMMQNQGGNTGQGMHGGMGMQSGMQGQQSGGPTMPGQDAFGAIQQIVEILEADPATDWSKVDIGALRQHLIDMHEVTLHAAVAEQALGNGIELTVTGEGRTLEAI